MPDSLTITRDWFAMLEALPTVQSRWNVLYAVSRFAFDGVKPEGLDTLEKGVFMTIKPTLLRLRQNARYYNKHKKSPTESDTESVPTESVACEVRPTESDTESVATESVGENDDLLFNIVDSHGNLKKDNTIDSFRVLKENRVKESPKQKRKNFVPPTLEQVREYAFERNSPADPEEFYSYHSANGWMIGRAKMVDWKKAFVYWERKEFNRARRRNSPPPRDYSGI